MSYAEKHLIQFPAAAWSLASTGIKAVLNSGTQGMSVGRFSLTLEVALSAAATVQLLHRPTPGSATGQTVVATLTLDEAEAAGAVVYSDALHYAVAPGEQLAVNVSSAGTGGTATYAQIEIDPKWEVPGNFKSTMFDRED